MAEEEYEAMLVSGHVQESTCSQTYVCRPSDPEAYAADGEVYVEFDVRTDLLRTTNDLRGWAKIIGPNSLEARQMRRHGLNITEMPEAKNIVLVKRR